MNLISHFACALPRTVPEQLGSVLPDLLRMFRKNPRPAILAREWEAQQFIPPGIRGIMEGIRFHHFVDSRFHRDPLFQDHAVGLRKAMEEAGGEGGLKRFFAAHLLVELFYDHLLLSDSPQLSGEFYEALELEADGLLAAFVTLHPDFERRAFGKFMADMLASRFVEDYRHHDGILYRTNRVLNRLGQRALNENESRVVRLYFQEFFPLCKTALLQFVTTMQEWDGDWHPGESETSLPQISRG